MISPIVKLLKSAKRYKDWKMVAEAIKELERIDKEKSNVLQYAAPLKLPQNIDIPLTSIMSQEDIDKAHKDMDDEILRKSEDGGISKEKLMAQKLGVTNKSNKVERPNVFVDDLSECVDDIEFTKKFITKAPSERREAVSQLDVQCKKCMRHFSVFPSQLKRDAEGKITGFVCNSCEGPTG